MGKSAKGFIESSRNGTYRVRIKLNGEACDGPLRSRRSSAEADLAQVPGCIDNAKKRALLVRLKQSCGRSGRRGRPCLKKAQGEREAAQGTEKEEEGEHEGEEDEEKADEGHRGADLVAYEGRGAGLTELIGEEESASWAVVPASTRIPKGEKGKSTVEGNASCEKCAAPGEAVAQTSVAVWLAKSGRKQKLEGAHPEAPGQKVLRVSSLRPPSEESAKCGRGLNLGLGDHEHTPEAWRQVASSGLRDACGRAMARGLI